MSNEDQARVLLDVIEMLTTLLPPTSGTATVGGGDICHEVAKVRQFTAEESRSAGIRLDEVLLIGARRVDPDRP